MTDRGPLSHKAGIFWPLAALLVLADCTSKELAVEHLEPAHVPHDVLGSALRFTLAYNSGSAFGLDLGPWSRPLLIASTLVILAGLGTLYLRAHPGERVSALALALVCGGAVGNLLDRLRSPHGVVDFIDVGVGTHRFWTFNLADTAITIGAVLLAMIFARAEPSGIASERPPRHH